VTKKRKRAKLSDAQRVSDERLRESLRTADLRAFDKAMAKGFFKK